MFIEMCKRQAGRAIFGFGAVVGAGLLLSGCGGGLHEGQERAGSELSGRIVIDGSSTVFPISEAVADAFRQPYPRIHVPTGVSGTGGGFKRFTQGETDISNASRPMKPDEFARCQQNQVAFVELPVAYDGLTLVVHPDNDWAEQLTLEQIQRIFLARDTARKWSEVEPNWPDLEIKIYAPGADSGTFDYFREVVAGAGESFHSNMSTSEDDNVLVTGVAGQKNAIGYFGASYYFNNRDVLKAVKIVNPETGEAVAPTPEAVERGEYVPFSRPLLIYVNQAALKRPEVKKFVEFYLEHAGELAAQVDYVPLPAELYERARQFYAERLTGTCFMTAEGASRRGPLQEVYRPENRLQTF